MSMKQKEDEVECQTYKINVTQEREGTVEVDATHLARAMFLAEKEVEENPEEVEWETEEISAPSGSTNTRG